MRNNIRIVCALSLAFLFAPIISLLAADDPLAWPPITSQARPWAWWWWHGSAVDRTNITHELQRFHDAGLGGVQITSIYGVKGAEARDIPYLTPEWLTMMGYTVDEARRLGMDVDMTLGSGWCFGGPTVDAQDANASVVVKTFPLAMGERISEKLDPKTIQALIAFDGQGKSIDLTDSVTTNGEAFFSPPGNWIGLTNSTPPKTWTVYAVSQKPSGQKVKRPGPGGEGWMLNPAYAQSVRDWLPWFDQAFANYTGTKPHAVFQDSYEYRTDWSPDFFAQFEKLRGYKLQTELPALFGDARDDHAARVKYDYRRTISDLMVEQSEPVWIDWAHKNGFVATYQAHGTPGNWLDLYALADIPETEMFHNDRNILISKFASSAAHTQGRELTGAETGTWLKEHFTETLADVKYIADDMFLSGVNHIFYHGACYSPDDAPWPGWLFYASTEMNSGNPIWHDVATVNEYIARCQSILQTSKSDNDILLYWPVADFWSNPAGRLLPMSVSSTDWFSNQPIGKTARKLWNDGFSFDYVSDAQLQTASVSYSKIELPGGKYRFVLVPECNFMPLETLEKLMVMAQNGATIIFNQQLPSDVPGLRGLPARHEKFKTLLQQIQTQSHNGYRSVTESRIGKGRILVGPLDETLQPVTSGDLREPFAAGGALAYVRLSFAEGWNYFIVNRSGTNFDGPVTLRRRLESFAILNPLTGKCGAAALGRDGMPRIQLAPGESLFLRAFAKKEIRSYGWSYWQTNGQSFEIAGQWNIKFLSGGPVLPEAFQTSKLASWTMFPDTNAQAFGGTAKYEITFDVPDSAYKSFEINLGDVRQSARVKVNGRNYGTLITSPFRVIVNNLEPIGNKLEIEVTSVAANRIRDLDRRGVQWKIFKDANIVNVDYHPFNAADWPLTDCGLLGPVTLTPLAPAAK